MRPLPCMAICRNATTRRAASNHVSLSPLPRQCGARWAVHGRQAAEVRRAPWRQSRRITMSPSFINSSGSPTSLPSLLSRTCHAPRYFMGGEGAGTTSTHASTMLLIGPAHTTMYCGRWIAFVSTLALPPLTSGCSRVRATANLEIRNIRVAGQNDLLVDVTVRHNFKGTGHNGQTEGQIRNPDNPDHIL